MYESLSPYWIACFSKKPDDFSQWMLYGDSGCGIAIGFDLSKFPQQPRLEVAEVVYDRESQEKLLEAHVKERLNCANWAWTFAYDIARIKQDSFLSESEVRLMQFLSYPEAWEDELDFQSKAGNISHFATSNSIVPFTKQSFEPAAVVEVRLGPRSNSPKNIQQMRTILRQLGFKSIVNTSAIVMS